MDTADLPRRLTAELPAWVVQDLAALPDVLPDDAARMRAVHALADRNPREGSGGPFAALVVASATGAVVAAGVNLVLSSGLSSLHAEVVALSLAQARLGTWDLGGSGLGEHELVVNWRPCAMCYGAVVWSGVRRLVIAGDGGELEALTGFDEGPVREDWADQLRARGIAVTQDVEREGAVATFAAYRDLAAAGAVVYNARRAREAPAAGSRP